MREIEDAGEICLTLTQLSIGIQERYKRVLFSLGKDAFSVSPGEQGRLHGRRLHFGET